MLYSVLLFIAGLALIVYFSEKLVEATVGTSVGFGVSTFLISAIFIGFDPENLGLGAVASYGEVTGIAVGTIIGSAMVAVALAFGITAVISPMKFDKVPMQIPLVQVAAVVLFGALCFDGRLSRIDGGILLTGYVLSVWYLIYLGRLGLDIKPSGEAAEVLEEGKEMGKWKGALVFVISLAAIIAGSELLVRSSEMIIGSLGISETIFGITILALLVSIEELARELPAALKGRAEITVGNVIGSVMAFFLFNAGVIALIQPVPISEEVFNVYLPLCLATVLFVTFLMIRKSIPRWAGVVLILVYIVFFGWGYLY